ncbi:PEP-CTERM sorting domain-containing protein [Paucibacter sp. Y2R2-4]|uniref:PEP-CTERM sorting domain-containing protein n=1 Tax=Paucibacter sp. Y2R2-4 TaxID=2893553 RepID=UPI0021E3A1A8|nr:PEP-CTERM sorting domain-containing protein [Paucibacter sp. Y2R2-4]MCV2352315.1 PEP-CTERM sorting domain-containing protein [Paucibacter sp. Y2R2-4]
MAMAVMAVAGLASSAQADVMRATELQLFRDGTVASWLNGENLYLRDDFSNGNAFQGPNFPSGNPSNYSLIDLAAGADPNLAAREEGNALMLDSSYATPSTGATGGVGKSLRLRLSTNVIDSGSGLDQSRSFAVALSLSLSALPQPGSTWGLRLSDNFSNNNDVLELSVYTSANGGPSGISFRKQDFPNQSITVYGNTALTLPNGAEGIVLVLSHNEAGSDQIFGNYGYLDDQGNLISALQTFDTSGTAFRGETHTRVELRAVQAVPEPSTWALWFAGAGLMLARRRLSAAARSR